jgi:transcriptional regulator with XRE-family HTH domain
MPRKKPDPNDQHVGSRLRMRRMMMAMSQTDLGEAVGITFQQIQKYEKGTNRISASRLQQFSNLLEVPVPFFFEGLPNAGNGQDGMAADVVALFSTRDGLRLARSFLKIKNRNTRRRIVELVGAIDTDA